MSWFRRTNHIKGSFSFNNFTISANLAGLPAISVPNGSVDDKPTGIQIIGNFLDESSILNFAHMFQTSTNWHMYTPEGLKG